MQLFVQENEQRNILLLELPVLLETNKQTDNHYLFDF